MTRRDSLPDGATESKHQQWLMKWVGLVVRQYPCLARLYAIPNGGARDPREAARLKAEGVKPGVPDLCLPAARGRWHGLYIEMKRPGRHERPIEQREFIAGLIAEGYRAEFAVGWDAARDILLDYVRSGPYIQPAAERLALEPPIPREASALLERVAMRAASDWTPPLGQPSVFDWNYYEDSAG